MLATVNGHNFTKQDPRFGYELVMLEDPALTEDAAIKASIIARLNEVLLAAEAENRGLTATQAEAQTAVDARKAECESTAESAAECRAVIFRLGFDDYDAYWVDVVATMQKILTQGKVIEALRDER